MTSSRSRLEFGVTFRLEHSPRELVALMRAAEAAGFDDGWVFDNQIAAMEPYSLLGMVADATDRLRLGTCVTNPASRHPTVTASGLATLNLVSDGRMQLGIGRGDSAVRLIGERPATVAALETSIGMIRTLVAGGSVVVNGVDVAFPWAEPRDLAVWVAGYGPKVLDLAARVADGVILQLGDPNILRLLIGYVREREAAARRPAGSCRVMVTMPAFVGSVEQGVERTSWYPRFLRHHLVEAMAHWSDRAPGIADAYLADETPDNLRELTQRSCLIGSPDDHLDRVEELRGLGVEHVNLYLMDQGQAETIEAYGASILPHVERSGAGRTANR